MSARSRGHVLVTTLVLSFVCFLLALVAYSEALLTLGWETRRGNEQAAQDLAEAAIATAVIELRDNPNFAREGGRVFLQPEVFEGDGTALLTFDVTEGPHYSTDNLEGETAVAGAHGRLVPPECVDLAGVGTVRNRTVVVREVFRIPRWDAVVASSGSVSITGSSSQTLVAAMKEGADLSDGLDDDELAPGKLVANGDTLELDGTELPGGAASIRIVGEARHVGALNQSPAGVAFEQGGPLAISEPDPLPSLDPASYDPIDRPHVTLPASDFADPESLSGFVRWEGSGPLVFRQGLHLDGGLLFVDGDVEIRGGLTGTGALVATGRTTLTGVNSLAADSMVAVLSGGDLRVSGSGSGGSSFTGLVATTGDELVVQDVRVQGVVLAQGPDSRLVVEDAEVVFAPEATRIEVEVGWPAFPRRPAVPANVQIAPVTPADFLDPGPPPRYVWDESKVKLQVGGQVYDEAPDLWSSPAVRTEVANYLADARRLIGQVVRGLPPPDPGRPPMVLSFDLNRYLNTSGRLKSLFWQKL